MQKLKFVWQKSVYFPNSNQFALFLQLLLGPNEILVVSTHLKSGQEYELDRVQQVSFLLDKLASFDDSSIVVCGDFNCRPLSPSYNLIVNHKLGLKSAYFGNILPGAEPEITTYQKRENIVYKTIDYIFVKGFEVNSVLAIPSLKSIEKIGLPSKFYPSDHFSLACKVNYKYSNRI